MDFNASIVDQRIQGIIQDHNDLLPAGDDNKKKASAFVLLCMSTILDIDISEAAELFTDGGNDAGVDGLNIGEVDDGEFTVTIFQGKYSVKDLRGISNFPENGVIKAIDTVGTLFDPAKKISLNERIAPKIEEIRSLVRDGFIPNVRFILCNNGARWNAQAQGKIDQSGFVKDQVEWIHWNHDLIISVLQKKKSVNDAIHLNGKAVVEDFNYRRVLVGKVPVVEIAELFSRHDDLLLERNIRRYLGLHSNRVNYAIHETLVDPSRRNNFYFFNNGITMICRKFRHNALQGENFQVKLEGLQIINGGQTCKTIQQTLKDYDSFSDFNDVFVLVRIYELADDDKNFVQDITYATNSQNPVELRDLRSNDKIQRQLEVGIRGLGYTYKRQRDEGTSGTTIVSSSVVAESVLAIWRGKPHQAKFLRKEHFGVLYSTIFDNLNAAQALLAVLIFRFVENKRKRPDIETSSDYIPYASHYIALIIGLKLMIENSKEIGETITHLNFQKYVEKFEAQSDEIYKFSLSVLDKALSNLYGDRKVSLQQLSATFRRGDLLEYLVIKEKGRRN